MKDDWDKLSFKQQSKIRSIACNDWTDLRVILINEDRRDSINPDNTYGNIKLIYKRNGKQFISYISQQTCGREK